MQKIFTIMKTESGQRVDVWLVSQLPNFSRSALQRAIKTGDIIVNGALVKPRYQVKEDDTIIVRIKKLESRNSNMAPLPVVSILYEDKDMVVIDKPAGVTVHAGNKTPLGGTIVDWFIARYPLARAVGEDPVRPGVIHRLDKDTSGVLALAKTSAAHQHLKLQFQRRAAKKEYVALVYGVPGERCGRINQPLTRSPRNPLRRMVEAGTKSQRVRRGKSSITEWRREQVFHDKYSLLRLWPLTGRTHQIRTHLHWLGFPIIGDTLYTFKRQRPPAGVKRQLLHAERLTLVMLNQDKRIFTAPLAADFANVLESLRR